MKLLGTKAPVLITDFRCSVSTSKGAYRVLGLLSKLGQGVGHLMYEVDEGNTASLLVHAMYDV